MNPTQATPGEKAIIRALATALLAMPESAPIKLTTHGEYSDASRVITADFGPFDVGPMIGSSGGMKLAIQTLLGLPHGTGGDSCQIRILTTREIRPPYANFAAPDASAVGGLLAAIKLHLDGERFEWRVETSRTAVIGMAATTSLLCDAMRSPLSKIIRAIGRCRGYPAMIAIERIGATAAFTTASA